jgi:hypothetical protein
MLVEPREIERINNFLIKEYGYHGATHPIWRVVWSHDEFEKRWTDRTHEGLQLLHKEVRTLPKYRQWADNFYILERFLEVPSGTDSDLVEDYSYEPVWVFRGSNDEPLPPDLEAIRIIIGQVYSAAARVTGAKYKNDEDDPKIAHEVKRARLDKLKSFLFGDENSTTDALAHGDGVVVPRNYGENNGNGSVSESK